MKHISLLLISLTPFLAHAEEAEKSPYSGSADLGVIFASGNTETTTVKGKLDIVQDLTSWKNQLVLEAFYKEDQIVDEETDEEDKQRTAEKYFISGQTNYKLSRENSFIFLYGSHTEDKFGAFEKSSTIAVGYGFRPYNGESAFLDIEIGPGYTRNETPEPEEEVTENAILRGLANFQWKVSDTSTFGQKLSVEYGEDNTRSKSETSLTTKINGSLGLKLAYIVTHNSDVADDKEKTDSETTVSLAYSF
tara:strand:- start:739 stop:1485 length:747 start_codon:yes stop_codon:yes gene_type:complete